MKVYVAGPMTGYPEFNYPAFFDAARRLETVGIEPINPARTDGREGCKSWLDFMRASLIDIAACDGVATLTGWQDSRGAALEVHIARSLDLPVRPVADWVTCGACGKPVSSVSSKGVKVHNGCTPSAMSTPPGMTTGGDGQ